MRPATILLLFLIGMPLAAAHTEHNPLELADPGAVPGDLLYQLDRLGEALSIGTTFSSAAKARKKLKFAEERLAEALALPASRSERAQKLERRYARNLQRAVGIGRTLRSTGGGNAAEVIAEASRRAARHMAILEHRGIDPGETGYDSKRMAEDVTVATEPDVLERARKQAAVAGHRVSEMKRLAAANMSEGIPELARAYDREMQKLQTMADNVTAPEKRHAVNEVIARATQHHQAVLQNVSERVPAEAQDAIEHALRVSRNGRQHALAVIGNAGKPKAAPGTGETPQKPRNRSGPRAEENASRMVEESFGMNASQG